MQNPPHPGALSAFLTRYQPSIVMLNGSALGTEYAVSQPCTTLGRGPGVDLAFDDGKMSREHAAVEFTGEGFQLREIGAPVMLNGGPLGTQELKDGDRFELGSHAFQFVIEERS